MTLKRYYSIEEIGGALTDLRMHLPDAIRQGVLRYAIDIPLGGHFCFELEAIEANVREQINSLPAGVNVKRANQIRSKSGGFDAPQLGEDTLFIRHSNIRQCEAGKTLWAHTLETFDGRLVNLWSEETISDQWWPTLWLELIELGPIIDHEDHYLNGLLKNGLISTKELIEVTGSRPQIPTTIKKQKPFQLYNKQPDRVCKAICEWGNLYHEENKSIPSAEDLRTYMKCHQADVPLEDKEDEILIIRGQRVTPRSFKEYYQKLLSKRS